MAGVDMAGFGNPLIFQRWGKARWAEVCHLLPFHMLDTAAVLDVGLRRRPRLFHTLADGLGMERDTARAMLLTLMALHDIGKVAAAFQGLNPAASRRVGAVIPGQTAVTGIRHDAMGQAILVERLPEVLVEQGFPDDLAFWPDVALLCAIATGHHGRPAIDAELSRLQGASRRVTSADLAVADGLIAAMAGLFGWRGGLPDPAGLRRLSPLLNGLFTLCDWLGSSDAFDPREAPCDLESYYRDTALVRAAAVLDAVCPAPFTEREVCPATAFSGLFPTLGRPTPLQALADRLFTADALPDGPLLVVIEDLPGAGKTEAGDLIVHRLLAGGRADGAYFALPTMVTADAAFARKFVRTPGGEDELTLTQHLFRGGAQTVLAHSRRHHNPAFRTAPTRAGVEEGAGMAVVWFALSSRRALLADLGVGTVDQALAGALRARHAMVRLAGLWRKVLLVDEVHAYDGYMRALLESLLRWHGMMGDPVVLMSATLPSGPRAALIRAYAEGAGWGDVAAMAARTRPGAYPLLTLVSQQGIAQHPADPVPGPGTRPVRFEAVHDEDAVAARIAAWLAAGRSVVWFRNTVGDAVAAWERMADHDPLLYHARFLPADRAARETALLAAVGKTADPAARRGRLVITTQAAEQSLDLDADEMVIDLAPVDAVIQRLGRRRRHARTAAGALMGEGGEDGRPDSPVLLLCPPLENPRDGWYARTFRRAAVIYDDDARLWLSALYLLHPDRIPARAAGAGPLVLARDLRPLMDAVYADPPAGAPEALLKSHDSAQGSAAAERAAGLRARLTFREGLLEDWTKGAECPDTGLDEPRTRLIDGYTVILAVVEDGAPRLLGHAPGGTPAPDAAQCRSPLPAPPQPGQEDLVKALAATLPEETARLLTPGTVVFLTRREEDGTWTTPPLDTPRGRRRLRYGPIRGLEIVTAG
ncbi:CRISPR-associated endonuclease/helicase Cas3 [Azospirillum fermentarium]|uniref:CRISPR-associated helicase Cas3' n=1 Tax=Azospirillum fermentarium TaxID=1233114 RepID=UPI002226FCDB|nr:CRISPR-associated helicase Cas3' [Azospirillum fermentarium]MCW2247005.1 CRISPR-associated endonuclease/helicase Cas3 [Azospirillum fermentarium]